MGFRQCHCKTHNCHGALVAAHVEAAHQRADLRAKTKISQSQLHVTWHRVIPSAHKDVGPIAHSFPHPVCEPLLPLSPDVEFFDPPCTSSSTVEQEMLDNSTLTGEDIDILTFGSALPNLGSNFHSPEALLSAMDYFQEYNARTSAGAHPLTSFAAHHLPPNLEQDAFQCQLWQIVEEVREEQSHHPLPNDHNHSYENGFLSYLDENGNPDETEPLHEAPHPTGHNEDDPDPFFIDEEVQSDNIDLADVPEHITVIHATVLWLHLQFHLPCIACNVLLTIFSLLLLFLSPTTTMSFTTIQSGNHLLDVNQSIYTLPVCPTCHDVYPPVTSPLCHDTCTSCNIDLFLPGQTLMGNTCTVKTPVIKYPYLLSEKIASILKIPGIEATLDQWRDKLRTPSMYLDIFNGDICCMRLKDPDGKLFFSNNADEWHGPNGKLRLGVNLGIDWYGHPTRLIIEDILSQVFVHSE